MCNRYVMKADVDEIKQAFGSFENDRSNLAEYDNIYPEQLAPVLIQTNGSVAIRELTWGLPSWKQGARGITNVRNLESNYWKKPLSMPEAKCLVPVSNFCEWSGEKGSKVAHWFNVKDQPVFFFAGLQKGDRFAFLTCEPNSIVEPIHPKAMPVIIDDSDCQSWLASGYDEAIALVKPYPSNQMEMAS